MALIDPHGGAADLATATLRTPLAPEISFDDDPLRMLRAARFIAGYGLTPVPELVAAVVERGSRLEIVSAERIRDELDKLIVLDAPSAGLWFLVDTGLAEHFLPELPALRLEHDPIHRHKDVLSHTIAVVENVTPELAGGGYDFRITRLAALFHDIGKPRTRGFQAGKGTTFHHHDVVGARMTRRRMEALRYPAADIAAVSELVFLHLRFHTYKMGWSDSAVRRYVRDAGDLLHGAQRPDPLRLHDPRRAQGGPAVPADGRAGGAHRRARRAGGAGGDPSRARRPAGDGAPRHRAGPLVGEALAFLLEIRLDEGQIGHDEAIKRLDAWWDERSAAADR